MTDRRELFQNLTRTLSADGPGKTAKILAKELNVKKTDINSILYAAQNCGLVEKTDSIKEDGTTGAPVWKLTFSGQFTIGPVDDLET